MAPTVLESGETPRDRCLGHEMCREFIDDVVSYAMVYHNVENPPPVRRRPSGFDDSIGRALVKLMRSLNNTLAGELIQEVVARSQQMSFQEVAIVISRSLCAYQDSLETSSPRSYFKFFSVLCRLCVKFSVAGRPDYVLFSKTYAQKMIADCPNHKRIFNVLHLVSRLLDEFGAI